MNPPPYFFFSYARADAEDNEPLLARFLADLEAEIRTRTGLREASRGFRDVTRIDLGAPWPDALGQALRLSRAFLALYSPSYFTSVYCGKEWTAFAERCRLHALASGAARAHLILPIVWTPIKLEDYPLSPEVGEVHHDRPELGEVYRKEGLRYLIRRHPADLYTQFVMELGKHLVDLVARHDLSPAPTLPDIKALPSAFHQAPAGPAKPPGAPAPRPAPRDLGLNHVKFVILAGSADELEKVRRRTDCYAAHSRGWLPYLPESDRMVAVLLQRVAADEGFSSEFIDPGPGFLDHLLQARTRRNLLVVVVDPWSLALEPYRSCAREYDDHDFWNGTVLIPFNSQDPETQEHEQALRERIDDAFPNKATAYQIAQGKTWAFRGTVSSSKGLAQKLREVLRKIKETLIKRAPAPRKVVGPQEIALPVLTGPGGPTP
jgi:FxsC-like protein